MRFKQHIRRPSAATALAGVALFVAVGSSPVADDVAQAATNLITGKQIKDGTVTTADVRDRSLLVRDFARGQLPRGPRGPEGPQGPQGPPGEKGADGERGPAGFGGYELVQGAEVTADDFPVVGAGADCPAGKKLVGGGAGVTYAGGTNGQESPSLYYSAPRGDDRWLALFNRGHLTTVKVRAWAICASPKS